MMIGFAEPYEPGSPGARRMRELHHSVVPELVQQIVDEIDYYPEITSVVRRQVAEEIAASIEAYAMEPEMTPGFDMSSPLFSTMRAYEHAARIAREAPVPP